MKMCECGSPAYKKDGSGWFCRECEEYVKSITQAIDDKIKADRIGSDWERREKHRAECREYARTHKAEARARWRKSYQRRKARLGRSDVEFNAYQKT